MANPAQLLLAQLRSWQSPGNSAQVAREPEVDLWLTHRAAIKQIEAISQLLTEMENAGRTVNVWRRYLPSWCNAVFSYPVGWQNPNSTAIDETALDHLETLADALAGYVPTVKPGGLEEIREHAELVRQTLEGDSALPAAFRIHAFEVVKYLVWCIDQYAVVGDFVLQDAVERLQATVIQAAGRSSEENRSKMWSPIATTFVWPFVTNILAAIPSQVLTTLVLTQGAH